MTRLLHLADCRNWRDVLCMALCHGEKWEACLVDRKGCLTL